MAQLVKKSASNAEDLGSTPRLERFPGEWKGFLPHYSGLENSMDCIVHGVAQSQTRLSDFHYSVNIIFYVYWETKKIHVICTVVTFT